MSDLPARIAKLKANIKKLYAVYAVDVLDSHHEPGQTMQMIQLNERQLQELERQLQAEPDAEGKKFILENANGQRKTITIVASAPDPFHDCFSVDSEIARKLAKLKPGKVIEFRGEKFTLVK